MLFRSTVKLFLFPAFLPFFIDLSAVSHRFVLSQRHELPLKGHPQKGGGHQTLSIILQVAAKGNTSPKIDAVSDGFSTQTAAPRTGKSRKHPIQGGSGVGDVGACLFSQAASSQVSWAQVGLTAVFGMGTGVPPPPSAPTMEIRTHRTGFRLNGKGIR